MMQKNERSIDEQIRKAIEEGHFDNLPGKGAPMDLSVNPYEDPAWSLAFQALRSSGYTLPWIEKRRQIEADFDATRSGLERAWLWYQKALVEEQSNSFMKDEWQRGLKDFRQQIAEINNRIFTYNLEVPSEHFQRLKIDIEVVINSVTSKAD